MHLFKSLDCVLLSPFFITGHLHFSFFIVSGSFPILFRYYNSPNREWLLSGFVLSGISIP